MALITKNVMNSINFLRKYTDKEKDNLSKYSSNIFTLNTFYTANKRIFKVIDAPQKAEKLIHAFWSNVVANMREWKIYLITLSLINQMDGLKLLAWFSNIFLCSCIGKPLDFHL